MWVYRAQLVRVLDGDTVRLLVDTGFYGRHEADIRLREVKAPELDEPGGGAAAVAVDLWMDGLADLRWPIGLRTYVTSTPEPSQVRSFARFVGDVWNIADPSDVLNAHMRKWLAENEGAL
jgi:endonuclease YncB( thermonuclease family)